MTIYRPVVFSSDVRAIGQAGGGPPAPAGAVGLEHRLDGGGVGSRSGAPDGSSSHAVKAPTANTIAAHVNAVVYPWTAAGAATLAAARWAEA